MRETIQNLTPQFEVKNHKLLSEMDKNHPDTTKILLQTNEEKITSE